MVQDDQDDQFGQNDLIPNQMSFSIQKTKWTNMVHFGSFWSEGVQLGPPNALWPLLTKFQHRCGLLDLLYRLLAFTCNLQSWKAACAMNRQEVHISTHMQGGP